MMQENYAIRKHDRFEHLDKLERLEEVLHHLKEEIFKKLIYIARCGNFQHDCHRLQSGAEHDKDTTSGTRFLKIYYDALKNYITDLKHSLSKITKSKGENDDPDDKLDLCE